MPGRGIRHSREGPALPLGLVWEVLKWLRQPVRRGSRVPYLLSARWASGANFLGAVGGLGRGGHVWHLVHGSQAGWTSLCRGQQALSLLQETVVWAPHALPAGCHCCFFPISLCCSRKHHVCLWSVPVCLNLSLHSRWRLLLQFLYPDEVFLYWTPIFCIHFRISLTFMMKKFSLGNVYICMILEPPDNGDFISVY